MRLYPLASRVLADGRVLDVVPFVFGRVMLTISPNGAARSVEARWWYDTVDEAVRAMAEWDGQGEPPGWVYHGASGRRRPGGDPLKEYVQR